MKKAISVALAVLMTALLFIPVFAAGYTVTFVGPSAAYQNETDNDGEPLGDAYCFVKPADPNDESAGMLFEEDENGEYVYYDNRYMTLDNIYEQYWDRVPPERYSPVTYAATESFSSGDVLVFFVNTSKKYNAATVTVMANDVKLTPASSGAYRVTVNKNLTIKVLETSASGGAALERNHYNVKMISGDGYNVKPVIGEAYHYTYFGDDFNFRIKIKKDYSASGMKVCVVRNVDLDHDELGDFDSLGNIIGRNEELKSTGVDADGCRTYTLKNVTSDCKIIVSGVREEKKADVLNWIKRIIRMILQFFGVEIEELDGILNECNVTINNNAPGVICKVLTTVETATSDNSFTITGGSGISFQLSKTDPNQTVNVTWTGMNDTGYKPTWSGKVDPETNQIVYTAIYNVDNIREDTVITIS